MLNDARVGEKRRRAGRRPSPIWTFFTELRTADNKVYACCRFCPKRLAAVASRMRQHVLSKCARAPSDIQQLLDKATGSTGATTFRPICSSSTTTTTTTTPATTISSTTTPPATTISSTTTPDESTKTATLTLSPSAETVSVTTVPIVGRTSADPIASDRTVAQHTDDVQSAAVDGPKAAVKDESRQRNTDPKKQTTTTAVEVVRPEGDVKTRARDRVQLQEKHCDARRRVHQKLVLALVLHDVPVALLEDEALTEAFALARPDWPRLSVEQAQTTVLQELVDEATATMEQALVRCKVLTLVHRHFQRCQTGTATEVASQWCNRWTAVDDHRRVFPLKEKCRDVEPLVSTTTDDEASCKYCTLREDFDAVVSTYRLRLAPEAVFCLCCDCPRTYQQLRSEQARALSTSTHGADSGSELATKPTPTQMLLGACAVRLSLRLRKELLTTFPAVVDLLNKAMFLGHSVSKITPLEPQLKPLLESSRWDAVPRLIKRMVYLENDIRRYQAKVSVPADEVASFWDKLRVVDSLLTPFSWMLALSEASDTTSAQYVVLWLWLLAIVESTTSCLLPKQAKQSFVSVAVSMIERHVNSHELVCVLLDPRVAGAGLSVAGKRRVKSLVVQLAERVFPSAGYGSGAVRSQLLNELGDYAERTGVFSDVVAWEMTVGRPSTLFWNDFVEDAPHLARVARAVISISPFAQTATESFTAPLPPEQCSWDQTFAVQQLKALTRTRRSTQSTSGFKQYISLLFPPSPLPQGSVSDSMLSREVANALRGNNTLRWSARDETRAEAIVVHQLRQILQAGGDDSDNTQSSKQVPAPFPAATTQHDPLDVGVSWFAFQSVNDLNVLENTVKKFVQRPAAAAVVN